MRNMGLELENALNSRLYLPKVPKVPMFECCIVLPTNMYDYTLPTFLWIKISTEYFATHHKFQYKTTGLGWGGEFGWVRLGW